MVDLAAPLVLPTPPPPARFRQGSAPLPLSCYVGVRSVMASFKNRIPFPFFFRFPGKFMFTQFSAFPSPLVGRRRDLPSSPFPGKSQSSKTVWSDQHEFFLSFPSQEGACSLSLSFSLSRSDTISGLTVGLAITPLSFFEEYNLFFSPFSPP